MKRFTVTLLTLLLLTASTTWAQKRVKFPPGRTTAILKGRTTGGPSESGGMNPVSYVLRARKGQQMILHLTSAKKNAVFSVYLPGMEPMTGDAWEGTDWSGTLPKSGNYEIIVFPRDEATNTRYTLEVFMRDHQHQVNSTQTAFFNNLRKMCGQRFEGATDFPQNADHPMVGKKLVMSVGPCGQKEIRIPFQVGDDKSRTWVLTLGAKGLLFKHDHRHPDGTPDQITMYGGWAAANGTRYLQRFPADPDTVKLIPEAATNVWSLQIIPEKQQFMYYLERNKQPRYRAYFNVKTLSFSQQNLKGPVFTSLYTDMKRDCRFLTEPRGADTGGDPAGVCKGYGGYRIFISHSAWSAQFSVERLKNRNDSIDLGNDYGGYGARGEKVEWRTANGVPFAVIMRLGKYKERDDGENPYVVANRAGSTLVVKGLKGWEHVDFTVDGADPVANVKARELADQNYSRRQ